MIAIIDYGMGNLRSAQKGFEEAGCDAVVTDDPNRIADADGVVLPGVGAYKDCYEGLAARGLVKPILDAVDSGKPFLGICVGLQLLFEGSEEGSCDHGLGVFKGRVVRFPHGPGSPYKVPHMGWNELRPVPGRPTALLEDGAHPYVYFVHSYYAQPTDESVVLATACHGVDFPAMLGRDNVFAVQFHPEKSQKDGLAILRAFGRLTEGKNR